MSRDTVLRQNRAQCHVTQFLGTTVKRHKSRYYIPSKARRQLSKRKHSEIQPRLPSFQRELQKIMLAYFNIFQYMHGPRSYAFWHSYIWIQIRTSIPEKKVFFRLDKKRTGQPAFSLKLQRIHISTNGKYFVASSSSWRQMVTWHSTNILVSQPQVFDWGTGFLKRIAQSTSPKHSDIQ